MIKHFNHTLSKNCKVKWFLTSKSARFSKFFVLHIILFERVLKVKNLEMNEIDIFILVLGLKESIELEYNTLTKGISIMRISNFPFRKFAIISKKIKIHIF